MQYLFALFIIVVFNVIAAVIANYTGQTYGEALAALAVGGLAMLAADYYTTKEGR